MSAEQGAVECLVIEASLLREEDNTTTWGSISDVITAGGGTIIQASIDHDAGKQLMGFGGALALLRWRT
jgi:stalled ribosome rescue protein Dom34